jgi:hypothetical protein
MGSRTDALTTMQTLTATGTAHAVFDDETPCELVDDLLDDATCAALTEARSVLAGRSNSALMGELMWSTQFHLTADGAEVTVTAVAVTVPMAA